MDFPRRLSPSAAAAAPFPALLAALLAACAPSKVACPEDYRPDFAEAARFAAKASLAYDADSTVRAACGADSCFIVAGARTGTRAFLQRDDSARVQWLAFRGTRTLADIRVDARYAQTRDTALAQTFHAGFAAAAEDLLAGLEPHLKEGYATYLTGHSLGGALAAIAALRLDARGYTVKAVTFGQPKVTNEAGARRSARIDLVRYIHGRDIVALVPPLDWRPGEDLGSYAHFGREVALDAQGYECLDRHFSKRYDPKSWWDQAQAESVADHAMARYLARLAELAGAAPAVASVPDPAP